MRHGNIFDLDGTDPLAARFDRLRATPFPDEPDALTVNGILR